MAVHCPVRGRASADIPLRTAQQGAKNYDANLRRTESERAQVARQKNANGSVRNPRSARVATSRLPPAVALTGGNQERIDDRKVKAMKFVIGGERSTSPKVDSALIKAVARAHCWFEDLGRRSGDVDGRTGQA